MRSRAICRILVAIVAMMSCGTGVMAAELVMVEQTGCHYCEQFHREIGPAYPNTAEGRQAPLRVVNMDDSWPAELTDIKRPFVSPTFILVNQGREVDRLIGYPGDEYFWFLLGEMLEKLES